MSLASAFFSLTSHQWFVNNTFMNHCLSPLIRPSALAWLGYRLHSDHKPPHSNQR